MRGDEGNGTGRRFGALSAARVLWAASAVALAAVVVQALLGADSESLQVVLLSVTIGLAGVACLVRGIHEPLDRNAWLLLGTGVVCLGTLGILYVVNEEAALEFPGDLPVGLLGYPLVLIGWALLSARRLPGLPRALWLDSAIGGLAMGTVCAAIVYHASVAVDGFTAAERSQVTYVLVDASLAGTMFVACSLAGLRRAKTLLLLATGATGFALVDIVFAENVGNGDPVFTPYLAAGWAAAVVVGAAAATVIDGPPRAKHRRGLSLVAVPVIAPAAALAVPLSNWGENRLLTLVASAVVFLSLVRLAVSLMDNQRAEERRRREEDEHRAREEAERANRAKTAFLGRMSHEVRTPLNSILGFAQLLVDDVDGPERQSVERILRAGNHLRQLIDDILDLSSIEAGETAMAIEPVDLGYAIDGAVALMEPAARRNNVRIVRRDASDAPALVSADPQRLQQVLLNLISNAIKYGGADSEVIVRAHRDGDRARVAVIDTGPGIAPEHLEKLFTPFERGKARGSGIEGSGLGLALTKNLVETMGGAIGLETGDGGSSFWFALPVGEAEEPAVAPRKPAPAAAAEGAQTILYIEDHASNVALVERLLARRDEYELVTAMTGRAGLSLAAGVLPELVLLDLDLPDIRGEDVLAELRANPATAHIPVIVVSADATAWRQEQLRQAGAIAYVVKPLQLASFLATLDSALGRPAARSQ